MTAEVSAAALDLAAYVREGDTVLCGQACAEPLTLTEALVRRRAAIGRCRVFLGPSFSGTFRPEHGDHIMFTSYGGSGRNQDLARAGLLDVVPSHYSELPGLFADGTLRADVALLLLSPRGADGRYNMGLANDYQVEAARRARMVIAEINDQVPAVPGGELPEDVRLDVLVHASRPPVMLPPAKLGEVERRIATHVAPL